MTTSVKNRVNSSWLDLNRLILIPLSNYNLSESNSTVTKTPSSLAQATAIYSASKSRITWLHGISTEKKERHTQLIPDMKKKISYQFDQKKKIESKMKSEYKSCFLFSFCLIKFI